MERKWIANNISVMDAHRIKIEGCIDTYAAPQFETNCVIVYQETNGDPIYIGWIDDESNSLSEQIEDDVLSEVAADSFDGDGDVIALTMELDDAEEDLATVSQLREQIWQHFVYAYNKTCEDYWAK